MIATLLCLAFPNIFVVRQTLILTLTCDVFIKLLRNMREIARELHIFFRSATTVFILTRVSPRYDGSDDRRRYVRQLLNKVGPPTCCKLKASPNYPHLRIMWIYNSIKIAFTNSELPKIIHTFFIPWKDGWACAVQGKNVTFGRTLEIICIILEVLSQIPKSAPDADIMRIIAALKKCGLFWSHSNIMTE